MVEKKSYIAIAYTIFDEHNFEKLLIIDTHSPQIKFLILNKWAISLCFTVI